MQQECLHFHLPGLFEFHDFYLKFLPLFYGHPEFFYGWCDIGSVYGAPEGCIWAGGRTGSGNADSDSVLDLMLEYDISPRLTFSNLLLGKEHLADRKCNRLCRLFNESKAKTGIIVSSDILLEYLSEKFPDFYFVSSTTKVLTDFGQLKDEVNREEFRYVVPDFRLNKKFKELDSLSERQKDKIEFLCNECCFFGCKDRKKCYENVSMKNLGAECPDFICRSPDGNKGYRFSLAMKNHGFISVDDIQKVYAPMGFSNFKVEGRGLGSALLLEFILHYMTKPECQLEVREEMYLDCMLDLF